MSPGPRRDLAAIERAVAVICARQVVRAAPATELPSWVIAVKANVCVAGAHAGAIAR